ncbi:hypothetical protein K523DRAFT_324693 [Schizophyllum commune Tattone D]|nr:hypothetical protein K523DRAFT_324693 [Schizophyllum commune Tattone D]
MPGRGGGGWVFGTVIVRDRLERVRVCHVIANHQIWDITCSMFPGVNDSKRALLATSCSCNVAFVI